MMMSPDEESGDSDNEGGDKERRVCRNSNCKEILKYFVTEEKAEAGEILFREEDIKSSPTSCCVCCYCER